VCVLLGNPGVIFTAHVCLLGNPCVFIKRGERERTKNKNAEGEKQVS